MQSMVLGVRETEKRLVRKEYSRSLGLVGARFSLGRAHSGRIGRNRLRPRSRSACHHHLLLNQY